MLRKIGLSPGKKLLVSLISLIAITIPMGYVYNSIAIILFVLISVLSARPQDRSYNLGLLLPVGLFILMAASALWSLDPHITIKALGKEASLIFIPLAFIINRPLGRRCLNDILKNYSLGMYIVALYFFIRAAVRYMGSGNSNVFFYHELATMQINAIYLSVLFSLALMVFVTKQKKTLWGYAAMLFLLGMVFLLSSKNIIIIDVILIIAYYLFFSGLPKKVIVTTIASFSILFILLGYYGKIYERFKHEFDSDGQTNTTTGIHYVTVGQALNQEKFGQNAYFNGTAFRAYQLRIFKEMLQQDNIALQGYGLNTSSIKIEQKGLEHDVYHNKNGEAVPYNKMNFHNQYAEVFADLGFIGFAIVIAMLFINLKNGLSDKYFIHIAFAILMISVFLTESFLWRQRGVVFFTLFYCLFNDVLPPGFKKNQYEKSTDNGRSRLSGLPPV